MQINARVHPLWLENIKICLFISGPCLLIYTFCAFLLARDLRVFSMAILPQVIQYAYMVGLAATAIFVTAVIFEHRLCRKHCVGWENHPIDDLYQEEPE